jgi:hypothetical protein
MGLYSTSSGSTDSLSDENGVLSSGRGSRWSRCLEMRLRRGLARLDGDARAAFGLRPELPAGTTQGYRIVCTCGGRTRGDLRDHVRGCPQCVYNHVQ